MTHLVGRRHWRGLLLAVILGLGSLVFLAALTADGGVPLPSVKVWGPYFGLALALVVGLWLMEGLRTKAILALIGSRIGFWSAVQVHLASNFAAAVTPLAGGGPPVATYLLWRRGIPLDRSLAMVSVRLLLTFGFFAVAVPALLLCGWHALELSRWLVAAAIGAVAIMLASFFLFFYFVYRPPLVERLASRFLRVVPFRLFLHNPEQIAAAIEKEVVKFSRTLTLLLQGGWGNLTLLIAYTIAIWALFFGVAPVLLLGLGLKVPWFTATARQIVLYFLLTYVPLPGASGVAEIGYASLFAPLVPRSMLAGFVGAWRFLTYYAGLVAGAPLLVRLTREQGQVVNRADRPAAMRH